MGQTSHSRLRAIVWRTAKVLFGAWAFAVAGVILLSVGGLLVGGEGAASWGTDYLRYSSVVLFLLGVPIMLRWLK
jgi:ABC-type Co2+ transport system permease subunit